MLARWITFLGLIAALTIFAGCGTFCAQKESLLDRNWGRSFEAAKYNQILNPEADKNLEPVVGLQGEAADNNIEKYQESFTKEAPEPVYNISISGFGG